MGLYATERHTVDKPELAFCWVGPYIQWLIQESMHAGLIVSSFTDPSTILLTWFNFNPNIDK